MATQTAVWKQRSDFITLPTEIFAIVVSCMPAGSLYLFSQTCREYYELLRPEIATLNRFTNIDEFYVTYPNNIIYLQIISIIDQRTYLRTYIASFKRNSRLYVLQRFKKNRIPDTHDIINHFKIIQKLDHPLLPPLHFAFATNKSYFIVLEYYDRGSLLHYLCKMEDHFFSEEQARIIIAELISQLIYLHSKGIDRPWLLPIITRNFFFYDWSR
jgi:serine/threonine protein kinase